MRWVLAASTGIGGDVALGTLCRYFPSKHHVLAAIALDRHRRALVRVDDLELAGDTSGDRVADLFLRELRAIERDPGHVRALQRVTHAPDRATRLLDPPADAVRTHLIRRP